MREITSPVVPAPPPGMFANAVVRDGIVYVSGMHAGGLDRPAVPDMFGQTREALRRVVALVEAAGGSVDRIAKITVYVTDISLRAEAARARKEVFTGPLPAATMVEVSAFVTPGLLVEIDAIAHV